MIIDVPKTLTESSFQNWTTGDLDIFSMAVIYCKKCGEYRYLTPHAFWNISDLGVKCKNCGTIITITLENGELKK
jgi:hypothetical protein